MHQGSMYVLCLEVHFNFYITAASLLLAPFLDAAKRTWVSGCKRTVCPLQVFSFSFLCLASFSWCDQGSVRTGVPMVLFYTLPMSTEVSVFSSTKSWQELKGLREENNLSELGDQTKISWVQRLSLLFLSNIINSVGAWSMTRALK